MLLVGKNATNGFLKEVVRASQKKKNRYCKASILKD